MSMQLLINYIVPFYTIVHREITRIFRIWSQTLLPPAITVTLYFVIFGKLIGPEIGDIKNYSYMQFIAPGLIMMTVVNNAYANVVGSFYGARFGRYVEEMTVAPIPKFILLSGYVVGGIVRSSIVAVIVTLISLSFTHLHMMHVFITFAIVFLAAILFSLAGFCNAIFARGFDDITIIPTFVLTPLTYFGSVFYSRDMLSPFWQKLSLLNPIFYIVDTFRYGILGIGDIPVYRSFLMLSTIILILGGYCLHLLHQGRGLQQMYK